MASELWLAATTVFVILNCAWLLPNQPAFNTTYTRAQIANIRMYIKTGDRTVLSRPAFTLPGWRPVKPGLPDFDIPYPEPGRLAAAIDTAAIRGTLPVMFGAREADRAWTRQHMLLGGGLNLQPELIATLCRWLGGLLLGIGLGAMLLSFSPFSTKPRVTNV